MRINSPSRHFGCKVKPTCCFGLLAKTSLEYLCQLITTWLFNKTTFTYMFSHKAAGHKRRGWIVSIPLSSAYLKPKESDCIPHHHQQRVNSAKHTSGRVVDCSRGIRIMKSLSITGGHPGWSFAQSKATVRTLRYKHLLESFSSCLPANRWSLHQEEMFLGHLGFYSGGNGVYVLSVCRIA